MKKYVNVKGMVIGLIVVVIYVATYTVIMHNTEAIFIHMALRRMEMVNPSAWTLFVYNTKAVGLNFFTDVKVGWSIIALVFMYISTYIVTCDKK